MLLVLVLVGVVVLVMGPLSSPGGSVGVIAIIMLVLVVLVDIVVLVLKALWRGCYTGEGFKGTHPFLDTSDSL